MASPIQDADIASIPFSCSTNLAKEVNYHLRKTKLAGACWEVCSLLHDETFGDAGLHRKNGHREVWCYFEIVSWAESLECSTRTLWRYLKKLEKANILWLDVDPRDPGRGRIGWNVHFAEWGCKKPIEIKWGGARKGAGRPRKTPLQDAIEINLNYRQAGTGATANEHTSALAIGKNQDEFESNHLETNLNTDSNQDLHLDFHAARPEQVPEAPKNSKKEKNKEETDTHVSGASLTASPNTQVASSSVEQVIGELAHSPLQAESHASSLSTLWETGQTAEVVKKQAKRKREKDPQAAERSRVWKRAIPETLPVFPLRDEIVAFCRMDASAISNGLWLEIRGIAKDLTERRITPTHFPVFTRIWYTDLKRTSPQFRKLPEHLATTLLPAYVQASQGGNTNGVNQPITAKSPVDPARSYSRFALKLPRKHGTNA